VIPISLRPVISRTARDRLGFNREPSPYPTLYKSCKKFTWRISAFSERLLVEVCFSLSPGGIAMSMFVCLFVCLSAHSHISKTSWQNLTKFLCMLPVAIARSSADGVAIRYVLPVLWMTSCFHTMGSTVRRVYSKRRERNRRNYFIDFNQILLNDKDQQYISWLRIGAESAIYDCLVFNFKLVPAQNLPPSQILPTTDPLSFSQTDTTDSGCSPFF